jgi:hypothetical protein
MQESTAPLQEYYSHSMVKLLTRSVHLLPLFFFFVFLHPFSSSRVQFHEAPEFTCNWDGDRS